MRTPGRGQTGGVRLQLLPDVLAVCRLAPEAQPPPRPPGAAFYSVTWTADELSVICPEASATADQVQRGWRALVVDGPMAFDVVGVAAALTAPLAAAGIPLLLVATYDTDYLLVAGEHLDPAIAALRADGHEVPG